MSNIKLRLFYFIEKILCTIYFVLCAPLILLVSRNQRRNLLSSFSKIMEGPELTEEEIIQNRRDKKLKKLGIK